ncbi:hypothetical protein JCM8547_008655 [Rhodosporidiobolus lusitaniae]
MDAMLFVDVSRPFWCSKSWRVTGSPTLDNTRVAVLGAAGGIGQPLSLLLKLNPLVSELSLYDIHLAPGVAADVGHCNTPCKASLSAGEEQLKASGLPSIDCNL